MGKAKRIKKKIKENREEMLRPETEEKRGKLEAEIRRYMEKEQYAEVLNTLAELVQLKEVQPEYLYDGAYAYFMLGDYKRAASWVENVLTYDGSNMKARILLARICILEDRVEEGLTVFDFVLKNGKDSLSEEDREEIEDIVSYYVRRDGEKIRRKYPSIAEFADARKQADETVGGKTDGRASQTQEKDTAAPQSQEGSKTGGSAREILQALRDKVKSGREEEKAGGSSVTESKPKEKSESSGGNAREILRALKEKVLSQEPPKAQPAEQPEPSAAPAVRNEPRVQEEQPAHTSAEDAEEKKQTVLRQKISLQEKVHLLNAFAGGYYYQKDLAGAKSLLTEALKIDSSNLTTLTNMAWVLLELGEKEKAVELATQAHLTDFGLIRILRDA